MMDDCISCMNYDGSLVAFLVGAGKCRGEMLLLIVSHVSEGGIGEGRSFIVVRMVSSGRDESSSRGSDAWIVDEVVGRGESPVSV